MSFNIKEGADQALYDLEVAEHEYNQRINEFNSKSADDQIDIIFHCEKENELLDAALEILPTRIKKDIINYAFNDERKHEIYSKYLG